MRNFQAYRTLFLVIILVASKAFAQDPLERNVTIEKKFEPIIEDAGKISGIPDVFQVDNKKAKVDYSEIYQPLPLEKQIVTLAAQDIDHQLEIEQSKEAFIRLGAGNYWNTLGEIALPVINKEKDRLDLRLNHLATFGKKQHAFSRANLTFNHYFSDYDLYADVGVSHRYFNYYGNNFYSTTGDSIFNLNDYVSTFPPGALTNYTEQNLTEISRSAQTVNLSDLNNSPQNDMLWRYHAQLGFRALPTAFGTKHHGELNYEFFDAVNGLRETIAQANYGFDRELGNHRLGLDISFTNIFYHESDTNKINFWDYYAVLAFNPYYLITGNDWYLRAGFKTDFSLVHGRAFNPMPDVQAEWHAIPKWLSLYGGVGGSFDLATLNQTYIENPYIFHDLRVKDVYTPVNPYFGFKLKPLHNLLMDAYVDYRYSIDEHFFVNKAYETSDILPVNLSDYTHLYTNRFNVLYSNASVFKTGMRIYYNYKDIVNLQLKGAYNAWEVADEDRAWMKPTVEADFRTDVRINSKLTTTAMVFYEDGRYAKLGDKPYKMKAKIDVNLGATYAFNKSFSAFAKLNNLLNSKYQQYFGYEVQGINFMLGGAVAF